MNSTALYGGGIDSGSDSIFIILNSVFRSNVAEIAGGSITMESSAHSDLMGSTFERCRSQRGGAIVVGNSELAVKDTDFRACLSLYGGNIFAEDFSLLDIANCTFKGSTSLLGSAVYLIMSDANFTFCTLASNTGMSGELLQTFNSQYASFTGEESVGGAIAATLAHLKFQSCLIYDNSAQYGIEL